MLSSMSYADTVGTISRYNISIQEYLSSNFLCLNWDCISDWGETYNTTQEIWDVVDNGTFYGGAQINDTIDYRIAIVNSSTNWTNIAGVTQVRISARDNEDSWFNTGGNVGIGTTSPYYNLDVKDTVGSRILIHTSKDGATSNSSLLFSSAVTSSDDKIKAGIFFQNDGGGNGVGDLHFALEDTSAESSNVDIGDTIMTITHEGDIGIGTSTPKTKLEISDGGNGYLRIDPTTTYGALIATHGSQAGTAEGNFLTVFNGSIKTVDNLGIYMGTSNDFKLRMNATNSNTLELRNINDNIVMAVDSSNRIGIGTTKPNALFNVIGGSILNGSVIVGGSAAAGNLKIESTGTDASLTIKRNSALVYSLGWDNTGADFVLSKSETLGTNNLIFIDGSTNDIGIGIDNPAHKLTVAGDINITESSALIFPDGTSMTTAAVSGSGYWNRTASSEVILANTDDRVGIGTTKPASQLEVQDTSENSILTVSTDSLGGSYYYTKILLNSSGETAQIRVPYQPAVGNGVLLIGADKGVAITKSSTSGWGTSVSETLYVDGDTNLVGNTDVAGNITITEDESRIVGKNPTFFGYKNALGELMTTSSLLIGWNVSDYDSGWYSHTEDSGTITLSHAGKYKVCYSVPIDVQSGSSRSTAAVYSMTADGGSPGVNPGSGSTSYARLAGNGDDTAAKCYQLSTTNDGATFYLYSRRYTGSDTLYTQYDATYGITPTIYIEYLGDIA